MFVSTRSKADLFLYVWFSVAVLVAAAQVGRADSVILEPNRDNSIFTDGEDAPADLSNGAGPHIFVGRTLFNGLRRGLVAFDIAGSIPAGSVIEEVELTMHMSLGTTNSSDYMLHRVASDWGEGVSNSGTGSIGSASGGGGGAPAEPGDATWMHAFYDTQTWTNLGGDFAPVPSATAAVGTVVGDYSWESTPALVSDVQTWLDSPGQNHGWLIKNDEPPALQGRAKRFDSREHPTPQFRPRLRVTFSGPPPVEEVIVGAMKDNTMFASEFGPEELSNGAGPHIFAGKTLFSGPRRGLLAFDIASSVPAGATIVEAELILHMSLGTQGDFDFALHRLLADWGEGASNSSSGPMGSGSGGGAGAPAEPGDATWEYTFYPTELWSQLGGDFDPIVSAIGTVGGAEGHYSWGSTAGMVSDVQVWLDNPATNNGWIIVGIVPTGATRTAKRFDSREHPNSAFWPQLVVRYSMLPAQCATCPGDIDGDGIVNSSDIQGFVQCLESGGASQPGCVCADLDGDTTLSLGDVAGFVSAALASASCD
ncbi:MAG: DNRLRE domain-containing protein [Phycisphaerales bacterium]|nr:DNRLRE domain-containing protein [Phycisphaerales bacterium]MCB9856851.1 DNRLRE domain-containing protein [Phycisphaerales bacterium]MCB9862022.1 DNRLRE domain-containing protein [Phycisphaerales bacterium]